jgi:hypothetical protein
MATTCPGTAASAATAQVPCALGRGDPTHSFGSENHCLPASRPKYGPPLAGRHVARSPWRPGIGVDQGTDTSGVQLSVAPRVVDGGVR